MILTLDNLGERYGKLPSEVLAQASTLDIVVMDAAVSYRKYLEKKNKNEYTESHTDGELQSILKTVRK